MTTSEQVGKISHLMLYRNREAIMDVLTVELKREPTVKELAIAEAGFIMGAMATAKKMIEEDEQPNNPEE